MWVSGPKPDKKGGLWLPMRTFGIQNGSSTQFEYHQCPILKFFFFCKVAPGSEGCWLAWPEGQSWWIVRETNSFQSLPGWGLQRNYVRVARTCFSKSWSVFAAERNNGLLDVCWWAHVHFLVLSFRHGVLIFLMWLGKDWGSRLEALIERWGAFIHWRWRSAPHPFCGCLDCLCWCRVPRFRPWSLICVIGLLSSHARLHMVDFICQQSNPDVNQRVRFWKQSAQSIERITLFVTGQALLCPENLEIFELFSGVSRIHETARPELGILCLSSWRCERPFFFLFIQTTHVESLLLEDRKGWSRLGLRPACRIQE